MNKRLLYIIAGTLLVVGVIVILVGLFGQFYAGADVITAGSSITRSELSTVQSFIIFGGSMVATAFILFIMLNRLD